MNLYPIEYENIVFIGRYWIKLLEPLVSQNRNLKILVCVPTFNEGENISEIVNKSKKYADEVIVYDDGSTDDTYQIATASGVTVIRNTKNNGNRVEIRSLFQAAKVQNADIMVTLDSDGQHDPDQIPYLIIYRKAKIPFH